MKDSSFSPLTRRHLLGLGGTITLGGVACYFGWPESPVADPVRVAPEPGKSTAVATKPLDLESAPAGEFSRESFTPHVGSEFQLPAAGMACRLVEVGAACTCSSPAGDFVSFSLLFAAPAGSPVESAIHTLLHPSLGELEIFLSPVGPGDPQLHLEAVFSARV